MNPSRTAKFNSSRCSKERACNWERGGAETIDASCQSFPGLLNALNWMITKCPLRLRLTVKKKSIVRPLGDSLEQATSMNCHHRMNLTRQLVRILRGRKRRGHRDKTEPNIPRSHVRTQWVQLRSLEVNRPDEEAFAVERWSDESAGKPNSISGGP